MHQAIALCVAAAVPLVETEASTTTWSSLEEHNNARASITRRGNSAAVIGILFEHVPDDYFHSLQETGTTDEAASSQVATDFPSYLTRTDAVIRNWWDNLIGGKWTGDSIIAVAHVTTQADNNHSVLYQATVTLREDDAANLTHRIIDPVVDWLRSISVNVYQRTISKRADDALEMALSHHLFPRYERGGRGGGRDICS